MFRKGGVLPAQRRGTIDTMASYKSDRLAEDVKRELTAILRELKDPRIGQMLSIVRVDLSNDLSHCKV